ncbi:MAG: molybdate ABC transporter substrate-binding protein [Planctomycetes bacterium]|nr:molybdate ABC transporter substrate-binding protein [Planctomycetota bacterium]
MLSALVLLALLPFQEPQAPPRVELSVSAAASLRDVLKDVGTALEKRQPWKLVVNCASSGTLARQIEAGAKVDLFLSADEVEVDKLAKQKLVDEATRCVLLSNQLVLVEPLDQRLFPETFQPADLLNPSLKRLSLANTQSVPAGRYARSWLESKGLWKPLEARVLPGVDVRAALAAVESAGAQAGLVYRTDAALSKKVHVVYAVPLAEGPPIRYVAVVPKSAPHAEAARALLAELRTKASGEIFERFGFVLPEAKK